MHISTDIGGTFTDFVLFDGEKIKIYKVPSTPQRPELAIKEVLANLPSATSFSHGATIATNAVLERKGSKIGLITTKGFADILKIGRQQRSQLYKLDSTKPTPLVDYYFEIAERVSSTGEIIASPSDKEIQAVAKQIQSLDIDSVAICFLFSFLNPANERLMRDQLLKNGIAVSCSSDAQPEFREYERMSTTVLDAYVKRIVERYITDLEAILTNKEQFYVMQSNGGVVKAGMIKKKPVNMLLSGPAGGVAASKFLSDLLDIDNVISFDMGGTSADVSTVANGIVSWTSEGNINGLPIKMPMVDIVTVGAGGGSIAWLDEGDALRVGPKSAGAVPGPICYGLGGTDVTVTDCDVLCGFINPDYFLGGEIALEPEKAKQGVEKLSQEMDMSYEETIMGVWKVVNAIMVKALRMVSVERGLDTRDFALIAFGGAGPVHAVALAKELNIPKVIVPFASGVFSAYGILVSNVQQDYSQTKIMKLSSSKAKVESEEFIKAKIDDFLSKAKRDLTEQGINFDDATMIPSVDMRYVGQSYEINVPFFKTVDGAQKRFHARHNRLYGYSMPSGDVEIVTIRLRVLASREKPKPLKVGVGAKGKPIKHRAVLFEEGRAQTPVFRREDLPAYFEHDGAAIIEAKDSTIVVPPGMRFVVDEYGTMIISN
jgi:N-methylhydantoinase A